ncbi:MFS transporter [Virgibacillus siamensis]|uniref:MFS transporter n=1 Tax=Virgibacillus siamensis TaxID=480071 RepID=UPI001FECF16C|nr:MFS transporter [Virgibacillus siamensis]
MADKNDKKKRLSNQRKNRQKLRKDDINVVDADNAKKAVFATGMGNAMEWFDFSIYSYLAATIGKLFFPEFSGPLQLVFSFATFAVAFLVRPFGGMFFGMLGDRLGRKKILAITLIMMAVATVSIGFIPTYASIGVTAPILLLLARLVQGFSTGGEYSGAMTFIAESTADRKRGVMSSGLEVGTLVGYIFGSGIVTLLTFILGSETMLDWGWRIPFFIAGPIGIIGLYLRTHLEETPAFEEMENKKEGRENENHVTMKDIFKYHRRPLIIGLILVFFYNIVIYTLLTYMPSHLTAVLGYKETTALLIILIVMIVMIPIVILMGHLGDRLGNKKVIQGGLIGIILLAIPAFLLIGSGTNWMVFAGLLILAIFLSSMQGTMPSQLPSLFFTEVRYGALAITYNISTSVFGGTAPLLVSWLIAQTSNNMIPAYYMMFACLIGIFVVSKYVKDTSGKPLRGSPPVVEEEEHIDEVLEETDETLWWHEEKDKIEQRKEDE